MNINTDTLIRDCAAFMGIDLKELAGRLGIHQVHLYKIKAGRVPLSARMQERLVDLLTQRYQTYSTEEAYLSLLRRLGVDIGTGESDE